MTANAHETLPDFDRLWDFSDPQKTDSEELAELSLLRGNSQEAKRHFASAYEKLSKDAWFSANEKARLARMKELAGL